MTHEKGLGLLEDMNMLMFGFGPDAAAYKKKRQKRSHVGVNMCEWVMRLLGKKPKKGVVNG